jgi:CheY-like chemotaxis protein
VRVLLADDHKEIHDRAVCLLEPEFDVVGAVADGDATFKGFGSNEAGCSVIDISMPCHG